MVIEHNWMQKNWF